MGRMAGKGRIGGTGELRGSSLQPVQPLLPFQPNNPSGAVKCLIMKESVPLTRVAVYYGGFERACRSGRRTPALRSRV